MKVFCVLRLVILEVGVGDEYVKATPKGLSITLCHSPRNFIHITIRKRDSFLHMSLICLLVDQLDCDVSSERPAEILVVLTSHEMNPQRYVSACTTQDFISIHSKAHLVTSNVGVEWWTVPFVINASVLCEVRHDNEGGGMNKQEDVSDIASGLM